MPLDQRISHYRITAFIGRGAMGEVYKAVDERLGREVALKLLPDGTRASELRRSRFRREAQAVSALNHPGIVTLFDLGEWQGRLYLVMELVEGERFSELAKEGCAWPEALRLCADVADALGAAHARTILHRDVKSDNLMRTRDGRVKVLDFGLAKLQADSDSPDGDDEAPATDADVDADVDALAVTLAASDRASSASETIPGSTIRGGPAVTPPPWTPSEPEPDLSQLTYGGPVVGTPAYMSPEQARGARTDARAEVFSLGVVLYELLVGRRPFDRGGLKDTMRAIREEEPIPPSRAAPERDIPAVVDDVVAHALAKRRSARTSDMSAFAAALRAALPGERAGARRLWLALGALLLAGAATAGAAAALRHERRPAGLDVVVSGTRRLTFEVGCEEFPKFMPDGHTILYDGLAEGDDELMTLDLDSAARHRLTHSHGWDYAAAVSPDGARIVYIHSDEHGSSLRLLTPAGDEAAPPVVLGRGRGYPSWTSDGAVLFGGIRGELLRADPVAGAPPRTLGTIAEGGVVREAVELEPSLFAVTWTVPDNTQVGELASGGVATSSEQHLPSDVAALAPSPHGAGYYYARRGPNGTLLVYRPRGGLAVVLPGGIAPANGLTVSPDGRRLVWSTCRQSTYLARVAGRHATVEPLARGDWIDFYAMRLDDHRILFQSDRAGVNQVWSFDLDTLETKPLAARGTHSASASPDGTTLVYLDPQRGPGVWSVPATGGAPSRLTDNPGDDQPYVAFDERHVVFERTEADGTRVYVSVSGEPPRPITPVSWGEGSPSPTDATVVVLDRTTRGGTRVMLTDLTGAPPRPVPNLDPGDWRLPRISPDGKRVLLVHKKSEVVEAPLDGSTPPSIRWSATTESIAAAEYAPDGDGFLASLATFDGDLWLAEGRFP